jgi:tRNA threonylcarbamoyladenosine modification (KEOPS) complex  Pcc1 subunit|tara:strand:- start:2188 stop:2370 length:183 start_codon:yes stop_codon:yes gene_type:complete
MATTKIKITADDLSQAIGEYLYNKNKLPVGMEEGSVNFEVEDGEFVITITNDDIPSMTIN